MHPYTPFCGWALNPWNGLGLILQRQKHHDLTGLKLLIVEDETLVAMLLEDIVAEAGGTVVGTASRVMHAIEMVNDKTLRIDLAILDVNVGGEEVFPVAEALALRNVPFAFATGYENASLPEKWRVRPMLQKPFSEEQVLRLLQAAVPAPEPDL